MGEIEEDFDRWFVRQLEQTDLSDLLDISNDELITGQRHRSGTRWIAVAGAMHGHPGITLPSEPVYGWINGMGVVMYADELPSTARSPLSTHQQNTK